MTGKRRKATVLLGVGLYADKGKLSRPLLISKDFEFKILTILESYIFG